MGAQKHAKGGTSPRKCCKVFLCISCYSKTLSARNIYALFSQFVVRFLGFRLQTPTGATSPHPAGGLSSQTTNFAHPCKISCGRQWQDDDVECVPGGTVDVYAKRSSARPRIDQLSEHPGVLPPGFDVVAGSGFAGRRPCQVRRQYKRC